MSAQPVSTAHRPARSGQGSAAPRTGQRWGVRVRLLGAVLVLVVLSEVLLHGWLPDRAWPSVTEWAIRCGLGLLLAALCWRLMSRPVLALQAAVRDGTPPQQADVPPEWQGLLQAVHGALREQREAIDRQRVFLADASHQLRTPFAVLRAQLQGMRSGELAVADTLPKMLATVDRSSLLVKQILSMAKVEQLVAQAEWQAVNLEDVAREVCLECGPLIARKGLDFSLESVPVRLRTDAWMLGELLRNLLSNAIHHAPRGSAIGLVVRVLPGQAEIIVWDNGGGIDESVRDRLFEPFQSASGASGVGLGLSICRQIAQSMQAQVNLYNRVQDDRVVGVDAVVRWPLDCEVQA